MAATMLTSPFHLSDEDLYDLEESEGYRIVRRYLTNEPSNSFCKTHSSLPSTTQSQFLTHRTIIHSILIPLLQIRQQASQRARSVLARQRPQRACSSDLELAFRGSARGAFSWLQCFIAEEWEFCVTKGCPACTVLKVMHAEPFIRIVVAGCRLSEYLQDLLGHHGGNGRSSGGYSSSDSDSEDTTDGGPTLPTFSFWLSALRTAVEEDEFWGHEFWEDIEVRALDLEEGVKDLISQCCEVCNPQAAPLSSKSTVSSSAPSSRPSSPQKRPLVVPLQRPSMEKPDSLARVSQVKHSKLVKSQLKLQREEQVWMNKIIEACWRTMVVEVATNRKNGIRILRARDEGSLGQPMGPIRARSLTA